MQEGLNICANKSVFSYVKEISGVIFYAISLKPFHLVADS